MSYVFYLYTADIKLVVCDYPCRNQVPLPPSNCMEITNNSTNQIDQTGHLFIHLNITHWAASKLPYRWRQEIVTQMNFWSLVLTSFSSVRNPGLENHG